MAAKLKCVIVDDDEFALEAIKMLCSGSAYVEVVKTYLKPKQFLKEFKSLDFDLCLLDIGMRELDGVSLARKLAGKPVIFITGAEDKLKDALSVSPIDIVSKPVVKERLNKAFEKASTLLKQKKEYALFNVLDSEKMVSLRLDDVLFVRTFLKDRRHKVLFMRNGDQQIVTNYKFGELLELLPGIIQVNKAELVLLDIIADADEESIMLKVPVGRKRKSDFYLAHNLSRMYCSACFLKSELLFF